MTNIDLQKLRNFMATEVMGWERYTPDFEDEWDHSSFVNPENKKEYLPRADWHPDLDSNQLDTLIDKMVEDGFEFRFYQPVGKNFACSAFIDDHEIIHPDRRLAVLLAIKAAKEL